MTDNEIFKIPVIKVSRKEMKELETANEFILPYKRGKDCFPKFGLEIGDTTLGFFNTEKEVVFRRKFSRSTLTRGLLYVELEKGDRFNVRYIMHLS